MFGKKSKSEEPAAKHTKNYISVFKKGVMIADDTSHTFLQYQDIWKVAYYGGNEIYFHVKSSIFTRRENSVPYADDPKAIKGATHDAQETYYKLLNAMGAYFA